jgi:hypothetical protein
VAQKVLPAQEGDQQPEVVKVAHLQDSLDHPQEVLLQVLDAESLIPEKPPQLPHDLGRGGASRLPVPGLKGDHQLPAHAVASLRSVNLEAPPALVAGEGRRRRAGPPRDLGESQAELLAACPDPHRHRPQLIHVVIIYDNN